ncbi:Chitinase A1 [Andreprevotia sp. IGB-42]|uniref:glycoside hydrolase family 18 protein n=1 Tax=Andreprevotia sp. IGB-42 TaxID=2497473 RepID=UPI00135A987C|nr:glycoside hydrolase family 18 protein [Andreprevotia sp. IGB-42]KAF0815059.1 Chitinase A1 [Andreprevotia sp. IGB-42]
MKRLMLPLLLAAAFAQADSVVLEEKFEGNLDLWVGQNGDGSVPYHATIVEDPLRPGNKVLRFDKPVFGGDLFTKQLYPEGKYKLTFDYLGTCGGNCGGVVGITSAFPGRDYWLAGTANGFPERIKDTKKWESYDIDFKGRFDFHLALEQWVQSSGAGGDVYIDNIKLIAKGDAGAPAAAAAPAVATIAAGDAPGPKGPQLVTYFTAWGKGQPGGGYWVKDIETSGSAKKLTVIEYAFGNVKDNKCVVGVDKAGEGAAADDYWDPIPKEHTLDGKEDKGDNGLFGHWNQLKQLKAKNPNLKVVISLGGWTWSKYFSDAALPANRVAFVKSCVDAYIKGNVPGRDGKMINAAGVFDGFDIDWEHPGSAGAPGNIVRDEDTQNFTALLAEFRKQLDAVKPGYLLTIAAGAPSSVSSHFELAKIQKSLNWINLMTYDFAGPWSSVTAPLSTLHAGAKDAAGVSMSVKDYMEGGVPPQKIVVGVPFYGYGWVVSNTDNGGMYQTVKSKAKGTLEEGTAGYYQVKAMPGKVFRDEKTRAMWKLNGNEVWTYDDPQYLKEKIDFIKKQKLGGMMAWELSGDRDGELVSTIYDNLIKQ